MQDTVSIPAELFSRMTKALIGIEKVLQEKEESGSNWVDQKTALQLLGCKRTKLFELKEAGQIRYKKIGRMNLYCRRSIEKHNALIST